MFLTESILVIGSGHITQDGIEVGNPIGAGSNNYDTGYFPSTPKPAYEPRPQPTYTTVRPKPTYTTARPPPPQPSYTSARPAPQPTYTTVRPPPPPPPQPTPTLERRAVSSLLFYTNTP